MEEFVLISPHFILIDLNDAMERSKMIGIQQGTS
jgi:hypothetical protein